MFSRERCRDIEPERYFFSSTHANVAVVRMPHLEHKVVRKQESIITAAGAGVETSQPVAVFIDHVRFNHGAQLVAVSRCEKACIGTCNYSPLIEGISLEDILGIDQKGIAQVDSSRSRLLMSMREGGYFNQTALGNPSDFYQGRFGKNKKDFLDCSVLNRLAISGIEVRSVALAAYLFLIGNELTVPLGMFPNDLNLTNVLYRHSDDTLRVIDQCMSYTSPSVVFNKLLVGWRGLVILARKRTDWSDVNLDQLTTHLFETLELDKAYIDKCISYYDWLPSQILNKIKKEVAAVQIIKTYLTLVKYNQSSVLPPQSVIDEVIGPFFMDSCTSFFE